MHNSWFCAGVFACYVKCRPCPVVPHAASAHLLCGILQKTDSVILSNLQEVSKGKKVATVRKKYGKQHREVACTAQDLVIPPARCTHSIFKGFYNL